MRFFKRTEKQQPVVVENHDSVEAQLRRWAEYQKSIEWAKNDDHNRKLAETAQANDLLWVGRD